MGPSICHVCLHVKDLDASVKFYEEAFDYEKLAEIDIGDAGLIWMGVRTPDGIGSFVELRREKQGELGGQTGDRVNHYSVYVDNLEELKARHREMGIIDFEIPNGPYFVFDNEGYSIEIMDEKVVNGFLGN